MTCLPHSWKRAKRESSSSLLLDNIQVIGGSLDAIVDQISTFLYGGSAQIGVEIQHKDRLLTDPGTIEDVLAVENDVVPFDRADVLEQGCVTAFLGDSPRSPRPRDLLGLPIGFETERSWPGVDKNERLVRRYLTTQRSGYHSR